MRENSKPLKPINWLLIVLILITALWFALSTYWYACKIKGSCFDTNDSALLVSAGAKINQRTNPIITADPNKNPAINSPTNAPINIQQNNNEQLTQTILANKLPSASSSTPSSSTANIPSTATNQPSSSSSTLSNNNKAEVLPLNNQSLVSVRTSKPRSTAKARLKLILNYQVNEINPTFNESTMQEFLKFIGKIAKLNGEILIVGHADSATGDKQLNDTLSLQRANKLKDLLILAGIEEKRITARGRGGNEQIAPNDEETGRQLNRRAVITLY